ncbi:unnamed protein product [Rhizophagus irregularis]|nr:unnamed protein product [Rhizophagus irregularis]
MDTEFIPNVKFSSISEIYPEINQLEQITRYKSLISSFEKLYNRFGVLPMAISRDLIIAVDITNEENDMKVRIANILNEKYPSKSWEYEGKEKIVEIKVEEGVSEWENYFKSGYKGILQHLSLDKPKGMYCLVDGSIPPGAGLSSSAAYICSVIIATCFANDVKVTKTKITETAIIAERFTGMNAGGMDQTVSIFSLKDHASYIKFLPSLTATPIKLPSVNPSIVFVVANSLITSDKVVTAPTNYNLRVVETKLAAYHLEVSIENLIKLSNYVDNIYKENQEGFTLDELSSLLNLKHDEINNKFIEASRVLKFYELCLNEDKRENIVEELGNLMNESHKSCKELFNCSCDELDELVKICLDGGAFGSRLTGAGWGGCTVSLIYESDIDKFIRYVTEKYYNIKFPNLSKDELENVIFATSPGCGAAIITDL